MERYRLGEMEHRFAELIWTSAPVSSGELVRLCEKELHWKKSTTYTMLKRLCDRGLFKNEKGQVSALMSAEDYAAGQGEQFLDEAFGGSLPLFLTAFTRRKKLSETEIAQLQQLIDSYKEPES